ncbi:MAG TPA: rhamnulose-1-phosphate aldolase [Bacteroidales bacterium]|nr:rhamnulose-1-phosphate aldolase [Bacteroidales bacterium]HOG66248.1 rhamnulose-1-phosphate aldolase [Bacteroidales bacterium]
MKKQLNKISKTSALLDKRGWAEANAGNISLRIGNISNNYYKKYQLGELQNFQKTFTHLSNQVIIVTGAGTRMRDVKRKPERYLFILKINEAGNMFQQIISNKTNKNLKPTSELISHLYIHNMLLANKREERSIVHTHPANLIALSHIQKFCNQDAINNLLWSIQPETVVLANEGIAFIPYQLTGSEKLAIETTKALEKHRVALWEKHGCIAIGKSPEKAFDLIDVLEKSAFIFFIYKNAGYNVEGINDIKQKKMRRNFKI